MSLGIQCSVSQMRAISILLVLVVVSVAAIRPLDRHRNALLERASTRVGYTPKELAAGIKLKPEQAAAYFYPDEQFGGAAGAGKIPLAGCQTLVDAYAKAISKKDADKDESKMTTAQEEAAEKKGDNPMVGVAVTTPNAANEVFVVLASSGRTHVEYLSE